ncbi:OsmC family protein [Bacillus sp. 179-C3.3 HS]|uniref:OsmC family protein n=1 Tax=Bacillus sp. 179-C3.3 HS TaxID=3232162 RepID=UPI00399F4272
MKLTYENDRWTVDAEFGQFQLSKDEQAGYRPYELFVSAIAGCLGEMLVHVLQKKRISLEGFTITPKVTREGMANRITRIHLHMMFERIDVSDDKMDHVIKLAMKHCSMVQSVKDSIDITCSHERI